jgi:hypothetical protein
MAKGTEVMNPSTGEIMPAGMMDRLQKGSAKGQVFRREDLIVPRLNILQDLSPQIKPREAAYVEGAKSGDIFNSVTAEIAASIYFIPARFNVRYVAWRPRPHGGLVDQDVSLDFINSQCEKVGIADWTGVMSVPGEAQPVAVEIIETPEWAGIVVDDKGRSMPAVISFPKTASKAARVINSRIEMTEFPTADGKSTFVPAAFYHRFVLKTALETSGDNSWFGWNVKHDGLMVEDGDMKFVDKASKLYDMLSTGEAEVADVVA